MGKPVVCREFRVFAHIFSLHAKKGGAERLRRKQLWYHIDTLLPGHLKLSVVVGTISQIEVNQGLVGNSHMLRHGFEVLNSLMSLTFLYEPPFQTHLL